MPPAVRSAAWATRPAGDMLCVGCTSRVQRMYTDERSMNLRVFEHG